MSNLNRFNSFVVQPNPFGSRAISQENMPAAAPPPRPSSAKPIVKGSVRETAPAPPSRRLSNDPNAAPPSDS